MFAGLSLGPALRGSRTDRAIRPPAPTLGLLLLGLCLLVSGAQALTLPLDDAALAAGADEIVRGEIAGVHGQWNADRTQITTTATVRVNGRAKGGGAATLVFAVPGGTADGVTEWVEDQPVLVNGAEVFVFVKHGPDGTQLHGGAQSVVPIVGGRVRGGGREKGGGIGADEYEAYLAALAAGKSVSPPAPAPAPRATASGGPVVLDVSPPSAPAGTGATITITGTGFGSKAERNSTADVGFYYKRYGSTIVPIWASGYPFPHVRSNDILSWSDTRIVVRVPRGLTEDHFTGSASSGFLWVLDDRNRPSPNAPFGVPFGYGGAKWPAAPVPFPVCTDGMTPALIGAIRNASATWNAAVADTPFRLEYTGTTASRTIGPSMPNLVLMGTPEEFGYGRGTLAYSSVAGGPTLLNCVMRINPMYDWAASDPGPGQVSLEAVALHEFGHWLYLMDLYGDVPGYPRDTGKVMFGYGDPSFTTRPLVDLRPEDTAAIRWIYANGSPPPTEPTPVPTPRPYHGPHPVPGTVEAEDYDLGGEGLGYHDATPGNAGGAYRSDGVDLYDANGTVHVGGVQAGEWLAYTLNATAPASVVLQLRASAPAGTWGEVQVYLDDAWVGLAEVRSTGAIDAFAVVESRGLWIPAGESVLRLGLPAGIGLDSFALVSAVPPITPPVKPAPQPYPGPHTVPGTIEAEDFDSGGEGVAYHDAEPANLGGAYRPDEGVDIETANGVTNVGWVRDGEWLSYTVTPAEPGAVVLRLRASNPDGAEKPLTIFRDGLFVATVRVPPTGSFGAWTVANSSPFSLDGEAALRLASFEGGVERVNLDWLAIEPAPPEPAWVPGGTGLPTDRDRDGRYEDVNGNGRADFADVVLYFDRMAWIAEYEPVALFDYNTNGRIDFADVVWLFDRL